MSEVWLELQFQVLCEHGGEIKPSLLHFEEHILLLFLLPPWMMLLMVYLSTSPPSPTPATFDVSQTLHTQHFPDWTQLVFSPLLLSSWNAPASLLLAHVTNLGLFFYLCPSLVLSAQTKPPPFWMDFTCCIVPQRIPFFLHRWQCSRPCLTVSWMDCPPLFTSPITYPYLAPFILCQSIWSKNQDGEEFFHKLCFII